MSGRGAGTLGGQVPDLTDCCRCPRLRTWCEFVAQTKRRSFAEWDYWGLPVPDFADPEATRLIVGLAPAAHGANRTGRMFTGDRSGDWLFRALYRAGLASQEASSHRGDGLALRGTHITAVAHCAPPGNKLLKEEVVNCSPYLRSVLESRRWAAVLCLGSLAWNQVQAMLAVKPRARFGHGVTLELKSGTTLLASFHPSQQNTFTGRLTEAMLDEVIQKFAAAGR